MSSVELQMLFGACIKYAIFDFYQVIGYYVLLKSRMFFSDLAFVTSGLMILIKAHSNGFRRYFYSRFIIKQSRINHSFCMSYPFVLLFLGFLFIFMEDNNGRT